LLTQAYAIRSSTGHESHFRVILTLSGSNHVVLQPLVPFGVRNEIAPQFGGQIPQKHFGSVVRRFQAKLAKILENLQQK